MGATGAVLAQVAVEYGALTARDFLLTVKQQVTAVGSGTLIIGGAVLVGLVLLLRKL
jgi:hypothetical protein